MTQAKGVRGVLGRALTRGVLLAGLLAMHGLVLGAHTAHAAARSAPSGASMVLAAGVDQVAMPTSSPMPTPMPLTDAAGLDGSEHGGAALVAAGLCVAVLLAIGMAVAAPRSRGLPVPRSGAAPAASRTRTTPPSRGPPRDLLAKLCVLRT